MGLKFNLLKNAPYERGGSRTNPAEAKAVAEAVIQHARSHPEQSLGVATFSVAQRQTVLKELELLRRANPDTEEFFAGGGSEPFFVKNLENIQGAERDIIFI
jgi:superfamily I DNA and/or RNA helicase